jgi:drug/metabolite transporter (DMT)-like permease
MGVLLGLATAFCWGGSDFLARFASRRIGTLRTMLYMQFVGLLLISVAMRYLGGWGHLADGSGWQPWGWGALAGLLNTFSSLALYRSFEIGKLSVVAPISASYPALTVALAMLGGERLTLARIAGIAFAIAGVVLVAGGETKQEDAKTTHKGTGVGWACLAALGFGVLFWILGIRVVPRVGSAPAVWMIRLTSAALTAAVIAVAGQSAAPPRDDSRSWILGMGVLDTSAFILNNIGMRIEQVSVVSVLASLYGAVTIGLAALFLRERISRWQIAGIAAIFAGVFLISR